MFQGANAQSIENTGWLFFSHKQQLANKFSLLGDLQLRGGDELRYLDAYLARAGLNYHINEMHSFSLGYTYLYQNNVEGPNSVENRIFQQYQADVPLERKELTLRMRIEQRFIHEGAATHFSQRARILVGATLPVQADPEFKKGTYLKVQNEYFINVQNRKFVNRAVLDQNRSLISIGYRFSEQMDLEVGYLFIYQKEKDQGVRKNIIQAMVSTNL